MTLSSREDEAAKPAAWEEPAEPAGSPQAADADTSEDAGEASADEVSRYLWHVYQRSTVKFDSSGDFSWKDSDAAAHLGMSMSQYVIGGMDPEFREQLYAMGRAMDAAGIDWTIRSAFRDDYRQGLASGYKAHAGNSFHGGSAATGGYGHGCAVDLASPDELSNQTVWNWVDQHGDAFGLHRPLRDIDAPHVQPRGAWHLMGAALRQGRLVLHPEADIEEAAAASAARAARGEVTEEQYLCVRPPRPTSPPTISAVHPKSLPKFAVNLTMPAADAHRVKEDGREKEKALVKNRDRDKDGSKEKAEPTGIGAIHHQNARHSPPENASHHGKGKPKLSVAALRAPTAGTFA